MVDPNFKCRIPPEYIESASKVFDTSPAFRVEGTDANGWLVVRCSEERGRQILEQCFGAVLD